MAQILPVLVSEDLLNYLFDALGVWEKMLPLRDQAATAAEDLSCPTLTHD